ncbi:DUF4197 domain-containing protein [Pseudochryseolinea flava]|uniref:DUF4197 domain-containing protein n=2 Tax=Pseudochryseolinea flava TaxID=2059302 RepID=A0A364Y536_9BACT|nr:DUF4197 domain-containing protein [Pseudochryseolinea flava]
MHYRMNKSIVLIFCMTIIVTFSQAQISLKKLKKAVTGESVSTEEVAAGLKEALTNGVSKGSDLVSALDGYYKNPEIKIPFPPEVKQVETKLRQVGMGSEVDKFILALNRGAEDAAKEAKPIFVSAIKQMTIQDAWSILRGEKDAATQYLKKTTTAQLTEKFKPIIKQSLEKTNATKYYSDLVNAYNKLPFVQKVNPNLDDYATQKGIDGLFVMIAKEEKVIREDPAARTSDLLKKVFSQK